MGPLEGLEQLAGVGDVEPGAVVTDVAADGGVPGRRRADLDHRAVAVGREFSGVLHQFLQDRVDEVAVSAGLEGALDVEADRAAWLLALEVPGDLFGFGAEVNGLEADLSGGQAGQPQQGIDDHRHVPGGGDPLGVAVALLAEHVGVLFQLAPLKPLSARSGSAGRGRPSR